jgi:hypothetical protein
MEFILTFILNLNYLILYDIIIIFNKWGRYNFLGILKNKILFFVK